MKTNKRTLSILFMLFLSVGIFSCKDKVLETRTFTGNKPIYLSFEDMRDGIKSIPAELIFC